MITQYSWVGLYPSSYSAFIWISTTLLWSFATVYCMVVMLLCWQKSLHRQINSLQGTQSAATAVVPYNSVVGVHTLHCFSWVLGKGKQKVPLSNPEKLKAQSQNDTSQRVKQGEQKKKSNYKDFAERQEPSEKLRLCASEVRREWEERNSFWNTKLSWKKHIRWSIHH